jgi:undecaprenyl-diphosphatase
MGYLDALVLGIVEGLTEFLPISSTAHLILTEKVLDQEKTHFLTSFNIAIQLGAILAVVVLYWRSLLLDRDVWMRVAVAFLPTAVLGLLLYSRVKALLGGDYAVQVSLWSLAIGGMVMILFERLHGERAGAVEYLKGISYPRAALIGACQAFAFVPGVSRAAATVIGGMLLGVRRRTIIEFSFLLAVPTMAAATGKELYENRDLFSADQFQLLAFGFVTAFVMATVAIRGLLLFIKVHTFIPFGVYRILFAGAFVLYLLMAG